MFTAKEARQKRTDLLQKLEDKNLRDILSLIEKKCTLHTELSFPAQYYNNGSLEMMFISENEKQELRKLGYKIIEKPKTWLSQARTIVSWKE